MTKSAARLAVALVSVLAIVLVAPPASAAPARIHGGTIVAVNANQSANWFGYNQGSIEQGGKLFNSITGTWNVPTATPHTSGEDEYSSTWIGIGGGCVDANCLVGDNTLIQTGTEQDVDSHGNASYYAWWEVIPAPGITISGFNVSPGDTMTASIAEVVPNSNLWTITLTDVTQNETFTQTVPYTSTHDTVEWIEETPLVFGTGGAGFGALPNLSTVTFGNATTNGAAANLQASEEIQLVTPDGQVYATPSAPTSPTSFNECTWTTTCGGGSGGATTSGGGTSKGGHKPHSKGK
jgi:Peptidase A4 family